MSGGQRFDLSSGAAPAERQETTSEELALRRSQAELAAAARRGEQASLEQAAAEARVRLERLDEQIESLLSSDPQEFVIRFLQTGGQ
jgi:hypothetical protein